MDTNELVNFLESHKVVGGLVVGDVTMETIIETIRDLQKKLDEALIQSDENYTKWRLMCQHHESFQDDIHKIGLDLIKLSGWVKNYG